MILALTKTNWREVENFFLTARILCKIQGLDKATDLDALTQSNMEDEMSILRYYPSWNVVRTAYNRRRNKVYSSIDKTKIFDLPESYTITKIGVAMLQQGQMDEAQETDLRQKNRWLISSDPDNGLLIFSTPTQLRAKLKCQILCSDGTFQIVPREFLQLLTIHGFVWIILIS